LDYLAFTSDGKKLLSAGNDHSLRLWDVDAGKPLHDYDGHSQAISRAVYSADGRTVATASERGDRIAIWDPVSGRRSAVMGQLRENVLDMAFMPDGKRLLTAEGSRINVTPGQKWVARLWDVATGRELRTFADHDGGTMAVAVSPDGRTVATLDGAKIVRLWDSESGVISKTVPWPFGFPEGCLAYTKDGRLLGAGNGKDFCGVKELPGPRSIREWPLKQLKQPLRYVTREATPGATILALSSVNGLEIRNILTGAEVGPLATGKTHITADAVSKDGRIIATASGELMESGVIRIWEVSSGGERTQFQGHIREVESLAFSPDGRFLVSGGDDTTALVWDVAGRVPRPAQPLAAEQLAHYWDDLSSLDAAKGFKALRAFTANPARSVPVLAERLKPGYDGDRKHVESLIAELDSGRFSDRERATAALTGLGRLAEAQMKATLDDNPSAEQRRRLEQILKRVRETPASNQGRLRALRAVEALEAISTPAAKEVLRGIADTAVLEVANDAKASLERLGDGR
jgi:dipeptidyl aminopeptidase/acylaminoacyl peptidase